MAGTLKYTLDGTTWLPLQSGPEGPTGPTGPTGPVGPSPTPEVGLVSLSAGWANYGTGYVSEVVKYGDMATVQLNLKRTIGLSVPAELLFATVPPGFRPAGIVIGTLILTANGAYRVGALVIEADGQSTILNGNGTLALIANDYLGCSVTYRIGG